MGIPMSAKGKVVRFEDENRYIVLQTKLGEAWVAITEIPLRPQLGDTLEIEDAGLWYTDGRLIIDVTENCHITLNGWVMRFTEPLQLREK